MKNVLVTGASTGIGNALVKKLIKRGFKVWGVARRENLLKDLKTELQDDNFFYTAAGISSENFWGKFIKVLGRNKFSPDIVILNAAVHKNDLQENINLKMLRDTMEINFFSVLKGVKEISEKFHNRLHFITISSTSAFKGNHEEGIGYAASKAALSTAFESLFQKYINSRIHFTTIFLGPVATNMVRFTKAYPLMLTSDKAAEYILKAIDEKKPFYYYPKTVFAILKIMRLLPNHTFLKFWNKLQKPFRDK